MIGSVILPALMSLGLRARLYLSLAGAVLVAFGMGRSAGKEAYVKQREIAKKKASKAAEKVRDEIQNAPDDRVDRHLDRWMRD